MKRFVCLPVRRPLLGAIACCMAVAIAFESAMPSRAAANPETLKQAGVFFVREYGAKGDGQSLDTSAIQKAIDAAGTGGGGQVRVTPGVYLCGTLHLKSHICLYLEAGAVLRGCNQLDQYHQPQIPTFMPEASLGKWHRGLLVGEDLEDVQIQGAGAIDGGRVFDPDGEEKMRGPHTVVFVNCKNFLVRDVTIRDSANYAIFFQLSDDVEIKNVDFIGGWDGVHWRGAPDRYCKNVRIIDCQFRTGDDCIAGRYWENTLITGCTINSSCNGIRLIGPAKGLVIHDNLFHGPGLRPHLSSKERQRNNMLAAMVLQPGGWDATLGPLEDVLISDNTIRNVASPVSVWTRNGNTAGEIMITNLDASGVYRSALSFESWAEKPLTRVVVRNARVEFSPDSAHGAETAHGSEHNAVNAPGVDVRPLPSWGVYGRRVNEIVLEDCRFSAPSLETRPAILVDEGVNLQTRGLGISALEERAHAIRALRDSKAVDSH